MPITFGAVGDIISVYQLVQELVEALNDARGSKAEYQAAISEVQILLQTLQNIDRLANEYEHGGTLDLQCLCETAKEAITKCKALISAFLQRICRYKSTLADGENPNVVHALAMKVRWRVGEKEALEQFRVQIAGISGSLMMLLNAVSMYVYPHTIQWADLTHYSTLTSDLKKGNNARFDALERQIEVTSSSQYAQMRNLENHIEDTNQAGRVTHSLVMNLVDKLEETYRQNRPMSSSDHALICDTLKRLEENNKVIDGKISVQVTLNFTLRIDWLQQLGPGLRQLLHRSIAGIIATHQMVVNSRMESSWSSLYGRPTRILLEVPGMLRATLNLIGWMATISKTPRALRPPRYLTQAPAILEDALGRVCPFHTDFITSWDSFDAVLRVRFRDLPGYDKILRKEYVLQDHATGEDLDRSQNWKTSFFPSRRIRMAMVFQIEVTANTPGDSVTCPGCQTSNTDSAEVDVHCTECNMWYRKITIVDGSQTPDTAAPVLPPKESTFDSCEGSFFEEQDTSHMWQNNKLEEVRNFKRARIMTTLRSMRRSHSFDNISQASSDSGWMSAEEGDWQETGDGGIEIRFQRRESVDNVPNDTKYCFCQRSSFGDMALCDNVNCRYQWFHCQCVGIREEPTGKWVCPDCKSPSS
jgi:hypothetical protein